MSAVYFSRVPNPPPKKERGEKGHHLANIQLAASFFAGSRLFGRPLQATRSSRICETRQPACTVMVPRCRSTPAEKPPVPNPEPWGGGGGGVVGLEVRGSLDLWEIKGEPWAVFCGFGELRGACLSRVPGFGGQESQDFHKS